MSNNNKNKPSFSLRLKAWWHGYELEDVIATQPKSQNNFNASKDDSTHAVKEGKEVSSPAEEYIPSWLKKEEEADYHFDDTEPASYEPYASPADEKEKDFEFDFAEDHVVVQAVWDTNRAHVAQMFWGDGYCGPGGPDNIINMTTELRINSTQTTMVLGGGLGGPVRAIQREYDTEVDGYEPSEHLANDGMDMSRDASVADKAPIYHQELESCTSFKRKYDRVYAKEALFTINNKSLLIETIANYLKEKGMLLLTDYIVNPDADQKNPLFQKWKKIEPYEPKPETDDFMEHCFSNSGLTLKSNEDLTEFYLHLISKTRDHARKVLKNFYGADNDDMSIVKYMHNEAVLWDTRSKLIKKGDIKVIKYLCTK